MKFRTQGSTIRSLSFSKFLNLSAISRTKSSKKPPLLVRHKRDHQTQRSQPMPPSPFLIRTPRSPPSLLHDPHPSTPLPPYLSPLPHQPFKINLSLHRKAITDRRPRPTIPNPCPSARLQQLSDTLQVPVRGRIMQRRITIRVALLQKGGGRDR